jgi:hydrogenase nickel incorporation protein HypA/HybF
MHELGITQSIVDACSASAGGVPIASVTVEIGCLCAVMPDALRFCFELCTRGTALEGSVLDIVAVAARGICRDCGRENAVRDYLCVCACGSANVEFTGGDDMRIREMQLR